jgi:hypothetical protein
VGFPSTSGSVIPASLLLSDSDMPDIFWAVAHDVKTGIAESTRLYITTEPRVFEFKIFNLEFVNPNLLCFSAYARY